MKKLMMLLCCVLFIGLFYTIGNCQEMFTDYKKKFALSYENNTPAIRYWLNQKYGFDLLVDYDRSGDYDSEFDNSGNLDENKTSSNSYAVTIGGLFNFKRHQGLDFNMLLRYRYYNAYYTNRYINRTGINEAISELNRKTWTHSIQVGPEVEIQVPYFNHLYLSGNVLAEVSFLKSRTSASGRISRSELTTTQFSSDGLFLNGLLNVGIKYYF